MSKYKYIKCKDKYWKARETKGKYKRCYLVLSKSKNKKSSQKKIKQPRIDFKAKGFRVKTRK